MSQVVLKDVTKIYDGRITAVHPMDLEISHGEFLVLVGPSGCGKSTTLRMIAGLENITGGTIAIGDRVVNDVEPRDRNIAMVFQSYALYPHMTVRDNMAFGLRMRKTPGQEIDRRVNNAAEILGIGDLMDRRPKALSGGQRQRVALGRAIVRDPDVFLFDEPLSNLDAKMRVQMRTEIARLHHRLGATMIYVTHDQTEAMTLGERIVVMNDGVVQQVASPIDLYNRPANRFVAGFIGSPAMNFVSGTLTRQDGLRFVTADTQDRAIRLPDRFAPPEKLLDESLVLGIRPEHVAVGTHETDGDFPLEVGVAEALGNETLLYFQLGDEPFTTRVAGQRTAAIGQSLALTLTPEHIHLFAVDKMGKNLLL